MAVVMKIADDGHMDMIVAEALHDLRHSPGGLPGIHRNANQL